MTYPASRIFYGAVRCFRMWCLYIATISLGTCILGYFLHFAISGLVFQCILQSLFYAGFGFLMVSLTQSTSLSITAIMGYTLLFAMVYKFLPPFADILIHNDAPLSVNEIVRFFLVPRVLLCIFTWGTAQYILSKAVTWARN